MTRTNVVALLCLIGLWGSSSYAVQEYYSLSRSVRALGMGGAFYARSDDEYALFYNPAGLGLYQGSGRFMVSTASQISQGGIGAISTAISSASKGTSALANSIESYSGVPIYGSGSVFPFYLRKGLAIGVLAADAKADVALLGRDLDSNLDVTGIVDSGILVGVARPLFSPRFLVGATGKLLYRAGGQQTFSLVNLDTGSRLSLNQMGGSGMGVDFDFGVDYEWGNPKGIAGGFAASLNNVLASSFAISRQGGAPPGLVRMFSVGSHLDIPAGRVIDHVRFLVDFAELGLGGESNPDRGARGGSGWKHLSFGTEVPIYHWLFLRGGFHQGDYTLGIGVGLSALKVDFATYGEELDSGVGRLTSRRFALRIAVGWGGSETTATSRSTRSGS